MARILVRACEAWAVSLVLYAAYATWPQSGLIVAGAVGIATAVVGVIGIGIRIGAW